MQFTQSQEECLKAIYEWYHNSDADFFTMQGSAGTGKTTLAKYLPTHLSCRVLYLAPTNKAAKVLTKKGVKASTIHSELYQLSEYTNEEWLLKQIDELEGRTNLTEVEANKLRYFNKTLKSKDMGFTLSQDKIIQLLDIYDLIFVDESSMLDGVEDYAKLEEVIRIAKERNKKIKIILGGDNGQLPPISGKSILHILKTNYNLTEIVRQQADNPIIKFANEIRNGIIIPPSNMLIKANDIDKFISEYDILKFDDEKIITGMNKNVNKYNQRILAKLGLKSNIESAKIVATKPMQVPTEMGIYQIHNGDEFTIQKIVDEDDFTITASISDEDNKVIMARILKDTLYPQKQRLFDGFKDCVGMAFNYCITAHKSQGSEYEKVIVDVEEDMWWLEKNKIYANWLYTAITRAKKELGVKM